MTHSGRIERHRPNSKHDPLNQAAYAWRRAFESACKHDDIPPDSKFVVFSKDNPFVQFVDAAVREFMARKVEYATGGYVGLEIKNGRAK